MYGFALQVRIVCCYGGSMIISVIIPACVRCLQVCPQCPNLMEDIRQRQAEMALMVLKEMFPWLPEPEDQEG